MKPYLKLIRPHHWIKNGFVLVPAFFAGKVWLFVTSPRLAIAFVSFCLVASAVYILNDLST